MINETTLEPLLNARKQLEAEIETQLEIVARLRKKREALSIAIDVLRTPDLDLEPLRSKFGATKAAIKRTTSDPKEIENFILTQLKQKHPATKKEIAKLLEDNGLQCGMSKLREILTTSPHIQKNGERDQTTYQVINSNNTH